MSSIYAVYAQEITAYAQEMSHFGQVCERGINDVLHDKAGPVIADKIDGLMPSSGRRFSGHRSGAKGSPWPVYDRSKNLTIVVSPRASRRHLYFPEAAAPSTISGTNSSSARGTKRRRSTSSECCSKEWKKTSRRCSEHDTNQ